MYQCEENYWRSLLRASDNNGEKILQIVQIVLCAIPNVIDIGGLADFRYLNVNKTSH